MKPLLRSTSSYWIGPFRYNVAGPRPLWPVGGGFAVFKISSNNNNNHFGKITLLMYTVRCCIEELPVFDVNDWQIQLLLLLCSVDLMHFSLTTNLRSLKESSVTKIFLLH